MIQLLFAMHMHNMFQDAPKPNIWHISYGATTRGACLTWTNISPRPFGQIWWLEGRFGSPLDCPDGFSFSFWKNHDKWIKTHLTMLCYVCIHWPMGRPAPPLFFWILACIREPLAKRWIIVKVEVHAGNVLQDMPLRPHITIFSIT